MGKLVPHIPTDDWVALRRALNKIASTKLGPGASVIHAGLTLTGLTASRLLASDADKLLESTDAVSWVTGTANQITVTDDSDGTIILSIPNPFAIPGKLTAGSFSTPLDVTATRQYGVELHYSGNDYDVTGIRSRAQLVTTDTTAIAQGALLQAANNNGIDAGVLNGALIEAIGKSNANAATIAMMRGALVNAEWGAYDTVTTLHTLHVRLHSLNNAGAGSFGTGYGIYIENEAVGGNGQALDAGIYFKGTNLSAGNKAFTYGMDFRGATYGTADIKLSDGSVINTIDNRWGIGVSTGLDPRCGLTVLGDIDILHTAIDTDDHAFEIDLDAAGNGDVKAIDIVYVSGDIGAGEDEEAILVNVDESDSGPGDIAALEVLATDVGSAKIFGLEVGINVIPIEQLSGTFGNMAKAENDGTPTLTQFITSNPGGANNIEIFVDNGDTVLIGNTAKFEEIEFIFETFSNPSVKPTFEFSTGGTSFSAFTPADGTNGMRNNGVVLWLDSDIPSWVTNTGGNYEIRITRTRANLAVTPKEDLIQIGTAVEYVWDKDGNVNINSLTINGGTLQIDERSSDPAEPSEGQSIIWLSDGTGYGDDGDVCIASKAAGTTKKAILFDASAGDAW